MATLRDIAEHCGLSVSTVSMALRDHRSISDGTKRRVWEAQELLGYKMPLRPPSSIAVEPVETAMKDIICLLIDRDFDNPVYAQQFENLAEHVIKQHWRPIYLSSPLKALREGKIPPLLRTGRVDGIIVSGDYDALAHQHLRKLAIPIVVIGRYRLGEDPWMACEPDMRQGIRVFLHRMMAFNHRKFGLFQRSGTGEYSHHFSRSYREEIREVGVDSVGAAVEICPGEDDISPTELFDRGATAILTSGDPTAIYEIAAARGLRIPEDLSVVGLSGGNYPHLEPKQASISISANFGAFAITKLQQAFKDPEWPCTRELVPMKLFPSGSIGLAPGLRDS